MRYCKPLAAATLGILLLACGGGGPTVALPDDTASPSTTPLGTTSSATPGAPDESPTASRTERPEDEWAEYADGFCRAVDEFSTAKARIVREWPQQVSTDPVWPYREEHQAYQTAVSRLEILRPPLDAEDDHDSFLSGLRKGAVDMGEVERLVEQGEIQEAAVIYERFQTEAVGVPPGLPSRLKEVMKDIPSCQAWVENMRRLREEGLLP